MLESLEIENFRGIKKLKVDNFKNINFFIGKANTSKTSLLESLYISLSKSPVSIHIFFFLRNILRDDDLFESLFYDYITSNGIIFNSIKKDKSAVNINIKMNYNDLFIAPHLLDKINGENIVNKLYFTISENNAEEQTFDIGINITNGNLKISPQYNINNDFNYSFITNENNSFEMNIYNNFKNIVEDNLKRETLKNMYQSFDKKIKDIRFSGNKIVIEIEGLKHTINIKSMGRGFQTYINILSSIISGNKYIFIDEIENGMHFGSIKILLENILSLSKKYNIQFFITTHNKELLEILNNCLIEKNYKDILSFYNIYYNKENNIDVINYSQENFSNLIENNNEMRD